jgi:phospholipase/carboxylesterase
VPTIPDRLAGLPVLLVQGSADRVIPTDLQARSWNYLHDSSGAALTAHRTPSGHQLTVSDVDVLAHWLALAASPSSHDD